MEEELTRHSPGKDTLLTIGVFDGVHLGHKYLISQLVELAGTQDLLPGVVTFRQHPQAVLSPQTKLPFLTDLEERSRLLGKEGVALVVPLSFTREWAELGARRFVELLMKHLRMRGLVIGADFALGRGREGDTAALRLLGREMSFSVDVVPAVKLNGEVVSSTIIRQALAEGDMARVRRMVGRDFSLHGRVVTGAGRGAGMGIPTANLEIDPEQAIPLDGVYATRAYVNGKLYQSMTNIGNNPTFGDSERGVEVYIIDYQGDLYGREVSIDIVERLRGEERFSSVAELKKQIAEDVKKGKAILDAREVNQV
ncbi:MAG: bifunctional riboflavin kinase/FAD synthetase [Chloroflexi bacterium]|nr:bifunctional riboflavin kinase/FAD synthetase [Chloroflexota bacterium]